MTLRFEQIYRLRSKLWLMSTLHLVCRFVSFFFTYLLGSAPLKKALTVSVNAAATGSVSWAPIVRGLGPLEQPGGNRCRHINTCILKHCKTHSGLISVLNQCIKALAKYKSTKESTGVKNNVHIPKPQLYALPNQYVRMKWRKTHCVQTIVNKLNSLKWEQMVMC